MPVTVSSSPVPVRLLHTMLRVADLERSLAFYTGALGMRLLRREEYPGGRFTLAFVGYGAEHVGAVLELTYNWDSDCYAQGSAFGHIALAVIELRSTCAALAALGVKVLREPGPMTFSAVNSAAPEVIAFIEDPDGYSIELIEVRSMPVPEVT
ncbi:MAG: lactoylglutathione lyase [Pseudomonadales bacterium RIFCSPLOWO2_12_59_9]|nr:MAG: lactoylglutathione lyase [Pseudomonadales bacterium RIFCSPLOWO2_12_59_9]